MLRLGLYIVRQMLPWMGASLFGAVVVFLASQLLRIAPVFAGAHAGASELAAALGLLVIPVIGWALTPAFAISIFAVAGGMSARGEITALDSAGIDRSRLIVGPCLLGLLMTAASAWIWLEAAPRQRSSRGHRIHPRRSKRAGFGRRGVASDGEHEARCQKYGFGSAAEIARSHQQ